MLRLVVSFAVVVCLAIGAPVSGFAGPVQDPPTAEAAKAPAATVNLNTATQAQLESLPGIGPRMAERIIEYRQKSGGFKKIEELMNVKGIGEKSFLKLKSRISVGAPKA